jgi:PAS domain S-box-containing protein
VARSRYIPPLGRWLLVVVGVALTAGITPAFARGTASYDTIWPANGILLAILLRAPRSQWAAYLLSGMVAVAAVSSDASDSVQTFLLIVLLNSLETAIAASLLRPGGRAFELRGRRDLLRFAALAGGVAPAATALLARVVYAGAPLSTGLLGWFIPDALGILTVTPFLFEATSDDMSMRRSRGELGLAAGVLALVGVVTAIVFAQSAYPLFFLVFPFLILAAYRFGFAGAAAGALIVAFVAIGFTSHERGPLMSIPDAHARIRVLQLFVATALATSLPFALLLDERKTLARAIVESEAQYRLLFEQTADALFLFPLAKDGTPGRYVKVNEMACHYLGYTRDELLALTPHEIQAPENEESSAETLAELARTGTARFERMHLAKDGRRIPVEISSHVVELSGGHFGLSIVRDVSERRRLEGQLRQAERLETIGRLAGGVAHDFNNVLTAVMGYAQIVERNVRAGQPADPEHVAEIRMAAERAAQLTRQLLGFSRPQLGEPRDLDVGAVLREMQRFLERMVGSRVTLGVSMPSEPLVVRIDPGQLQQIVLNLVVNARDATPDGGVITLTATGVDVEGDEELASGSHVAIVVSDTGVGMTPDVLRRVFEPFFSTKSPDKGTGIGLATVQRIVSVAKGAVRVESTPGRGTTFRVYLPHQRTAAAPSLPAPRVGASGAHAGTALLVEDDDPIRALTRQTLAEAGFRVIAARHVAEALALLGEPRPELALVVTDVVLPGASGKELVRMLRLTQPALPAVVMSGYTTENIDSLAADGARHRYLPKPFSPETLLAAIDELCPAAPGEDGVRGSRFLVVDDDEVTRAIQEHFLEAAGAACRLVGTGGEALSALRDEGGRFSAVLLDFELPDMTGAQVVARIRSELGLADLPVIAVTGHTSDQNLAECLAAGMVARVTKPIHDHELTAALTRWARRPG